MSQSPSRPSARAMNATALIAVLAMAASVSPCVRGVGVCLETRLTLNDSDAVRTVAAVVAAAARDLLSDRTVASAPALPIAAACEMRPAAKGAVAVDSVGHVAPGEMIGARLLDLPPPLA